MFHLQMVLYINPFNLSHILDSLQNFEENILRHIKKCIDFKNRVALGSSVTGLNIVTAHSSP